MMVIEDKSKKIYFSPFLAQTERATLQNEDGVSYPFKDTWDCINYLKRQNPARQKFCNIIEPKKGNKPEYEEFSGDHPYDLFASILQGIEDVLKGFGYYHRKTFEWYALSPEPVGLEEIAEKLGKSTNAVKKYKYKVLKELQEEFIRRELIPREVH